MKGDGRENYAREKTETANFTIGIRLAILRFSIDQITGNGLRPRRPRVQTSALLGRFNLEVGFNHRGHRGKHQKTNQARGAGEADRYRTACGSKRVSNSISGRRIWVWLVPEVEHLTRLLPQAVLYLSPASRANNYFGFGILGLTPQALC